MAEQRDIKYVNKTFSDLRQPENSGGHHEKYGQRQNAPWRANGQGGDSAQHSGLPSPSGPSSGKLKSLTSVVGSKGAVKRIRVR